MPLDAPVTTATLLSSFLFIRVFLISGFQLPIHCCLASICTINANS
jgi:hypothetical protein